MSHPEYVFVKCKPSLSNQQILWCQVPFEEVPELVASRRVFLQRGNAFVPRDQVRASIDCWVEFLSLLLSWAVCSASDIFFWQAGHALVSHFYRIGHAWLWLYSRPFFFTEIFNFLEQLVAIVSNHFRARLSKALVLTNRYDQRLQNFVEHLQMS